MRLFWFGGGLLYKASNPNKPRPSIQPISKPIVLNLTVKNCSHENLNNLSLCSRASDPGDK